MNKYSQKYCLVTFFDELDDGTQFKYSQWPMHITIADTFACDKINKATEALQSLIPNQNEINTSMGEDEYFGADKQVHVTLVNMNEKLLALHMEVVEILKSKGAVFNDPQYIEDGYKAHVTVQKNFRLNEGDTITLNSVSLVDMFYEGDHQQRKILKTFQFSNNQ